VGRAREGKTEEAFALMRSAVELEASTEKHNITPGPIVTARELLGDMLLEAGQPAAAVEAYEASLRVAPNRFKSLHASPEPPSARRSRAGQDVLRQAAGDGGRRRHARPELQEAKAFK